MAKHNERAEILKALGLQKAPELVSIRGHVAPAIAATLEQLSRESGMKVEEVVGLATSDWVERTERRLRQAQNSAPIPEDQA